MPLRSQKPTYREGDQVLKDQDDRRDPPVDEVEREPLPSEKLAAVAEVLEREGSWLSSEAASFSVSTALQHLHQAIEAQKGEEDKGGAGLVDCDVCERRVPRDEAQTRCLVRVCPNRPQPSPGTPPPGN